MIKIAALTFESNDPASRFRMRQHFDVLANNGILVSDLYQQYSDDLWRRYLPKGMRTRQFPLLWPLISGVKFFQLYSVIKRSIESSLYDVLWMTRGLYPYIPTFEGQLKKPLIYDVDDSIWLGQPYGAAQAEKTAKRADIVVAGNNYLAEWFYKYNSNVCVIPTAIDTERYKPVLSSEKKPFTLGWTGTSSNFKYLYTINSALEDFFRYAPEARLLVCADCMPKGLTISKNNLEFIPWSEENEATVVQQMDVGLMPLEDDLWARGKCSFKMLQYMACGIPVIASPVGMNTEVFAKGDFGFAPKDINGWTESFVHLYDNSILKETFGVKAREIAETHYSKKVVSGLIVNIFNRYQ